jgi:hypothetical protein
MTRKVLIPVLVLVATAQSVRAQENPTLDKYLNEKIKAELSKMNSPQTGYRDGPHWVHFDDPGKNLSVTIHSKVDGAKASLSGEIRGKIAFNYQVNIEKNILGKRVVFARHDFGGYADVKMVVSEASANIGEKLTGAKVSIKELKIENLKMRSDAAKPFQGIIQNWVNGQLQGKKGEFERKLEAAINTVKP